MIDKIFPFSIYVVKGHSMQPMLHDGDRVVAFRLNYLFSKPRKGDVVVTEVNGQTLVKRIAAVDGNKQCFLVGLNENDSIDSRNFGFARQKEIVGKVVASY